MYTEAPQPAERLAQSSRQQWETHRAQPDTARSHHAAKRGATPGNTPGPPLRGQARCAQPRGGVRRGRGCSVGPFSLSQDGAGGEAGLTSTHVPVGHVPVGAFAVGQHLPHDDAVAPDVAGRGELAVGDGLWSRPADGDLAPLQRQARNTLF